MKIFLWLKNIVQPILTGVARIFQPTDDDYPATGVQPFEGEIYDEHKHSY